MAPTRAENVLQRADELVKMQKPQSALELLYDTINAKRTRYVALETQEPLMLKFIELSIDLRAGKNVRDALHQYKKMTFPANTTALATAVETFLSGCRRKVQEAQAEAKQIALDGEDPTEDLEAEQTPEDLLMATLGTDRDSTDRQIVTPWLKFLWEGYRSVLDVLRNNAKLEGLYAKIVSQAFEFCLEFKRKTEFRRLCELLRNHLVQAAQHKPQAASGANASAGAVTPIDLTDPDTVFQLITTRFEQLKVAVKLELWQEAFRSVEDIHVLFLASRRPIKIQHLATYYETLAKICSVSNNHLFHAASWAKYYGMVYNTRETAPEGELERIASVFYLSVLCIPGDAGATASAGQNRLTTLLNMNHVPTRDSLVAFSLSKNILNYVSPEIRELSNLLEGFHPLTLKKRLGPIFSALGKVEAFLPYVKPLLDVVINRTFLHLAQSYTTVKLSFIVDILTFAEPFNMSALEIEKMLVFGTQKSQFKARINHKTGSVTFIDSLSTAEVTSVEDVLQPTPASLIRNKLRDLATCVTDVLPDVDDAELRRVTAARKDLLAAAERGLVKENTEFLNRKQAQRERAEKAQNEKRRLDSQRAKERLEQQARAAKEEEERVAREQREAELALMQKEQKALEDEKKAQIAAEIKAKGILDVDLSDLDKFSMADLQRLQIDQLNKEANDLLTRMQAVARKQDYLERAYRLKEAELWNKDADEQRARDVKAHEARTATIIATAKQRFEHTKQAHERYGRMTGEYEAFVAKVRSARAEEFAAKRAEAEKQLEAAKKERIEKKVARRADEERARKDREEAAKAEEARMAAEANKPGVYRPGMGIRRPAGSPAPAATPAAAAPKANPFGKAVPASSGPKPSPFGSAKPVSTNAPAAAAAAAAPAAAKPDPFGRASPAPAPKADPFGRASPAAAAKPKVDPFGRASPAAAAAKPKADPFGRAKPTAAGAETSAPAGPQKYVPGALRRVKPESPASSPAPEDAPPADKPKTTAWKPRSHRQ